MRKTFELSADYHQVLLLAGPDIHGVESPSR